MPKTRLLPQFPHGRLVHRHTVGLTDDTYRTVLEARDRHGIVVSALLGAAIEKGLPAVLESLPPLQGRFPDLPPVDVRHLDPEHPIACLLDWLVRQGVFRERLPQTSKQIMADWRKILPTHDVVLILESVPAFTIRAIPRGATLLFEGQDDAALTWLVGVPYQFQRTWRLLPNVIRAGRRLDCGDVVAVAGAILSDRQVAAGWQLALDWRVALGSGVGRLGEWLKGQGDLGFLPISRKGLLEKHGRDPVRELLESLPPFTLRLDDAGGVGLWPDQPDGLDELPLYEWSAEDLRSDNEQTSVPDSLPPAVESPPESAVEPAAGEDEGAQVVAESADDEDLAVAAGVTAPPAPEPMASVSDVGGKNSNQLLSPSADQPSFGLDHPAYDRLTAWVRNPRNRASLPISKEKLLTLTDDPTVQALFDDLPPFVLNMSKGGCVGLWFDGVERAAYLWPVNVLDETVPAGPVTQSRPAAEKPGSELPFFGPGHPAFRLLSLVAKNPDYRRKLPQTREDMLKGLSESHPVSYQAIAGLPPFRMDLTQGGNIGLSLIETGECFYIWDE